MVIRKYRRKAGLEAARFTGENGKELVSWIGGPGPFFGQRAIIGRGGDLYVHTSDGDRQVVVGDWIVKEANGDLSTHTPEEFEAAFEPSQADDEETR